MIFVCFLLFAHLSSAQDSIANDCDKTYNVVETMPEFPGGAIGLSHFVRDLEYPESCSIHDLDYVKFIINKTGKAIDIEAVGYKGACAIAIENQFANMPNWTPGYNHDTAVCVFQVVPIHKPHRRE